MDDTNKPEVSTDDKKMFTAKVSGVASVIMSVAAENAEEAAEMFQRGEGETMEVVFDTDTPVTVSDVKEESQGEDQDEYEEQLAV